MQFSIRMRGEKTKTEHEEQYKACTFELVRGTKNEAALSENAESALQNSPLMD